MKPITLASALAILAGATWANEYQPAMESYLETEITGWANSPVIVQAIKAQNEMTAGYDQAEIDQLDQQWRAEVGNGDSPIIKEVLQNEAANFLREQLDVSGGVISEIFMMDARGLNVAASDVTSDYWQGDEDKFQKTYSMGPGAVHFGEVEFDESSQTYQGQISVVIVDPESNKPIGAMTIGLNAEALL